LSGSLSAADSPGAILRTGGNGVLVNSKPASKSAALYRDDLIETANNTAARIESTGSASDIHAGSLVQFEQDELVLDHGILSVNTSVGMKVRVGCLTVTPVNGNTWTRYDVSDVDGKVTVSALTSDVYIDEHSNRAKPAKKSLESKRVTVREGEQKSREDKCGAGYAAQPAASPAHGPILNSPWVRLAAGVGAGAITCFGICHDDDPISPHTP
jgi:hypothetical protein